MLRILNFSMAIGGAVGIAWYMNSQIMFPPMIAFFIVVSVCGLIGGLALWTGQRQLLLLSMICYVLSLAILAGLQVLAFAVSPGSGVAVAPILGATAMVCIMSFNQARVAAVKVFK